MGNTHYFEMTLMKSYKLVTLAALAILMLAGVCSAKPPVDHSADKMKTLIGRRLVRSLDEACDPTHFLTRQHRRRLPSSIRENKVRTRCRGRRLRGGSAEPE